MDAKLIVIGTIIVGCLIVVLFAYKKMTYTGNGPTQNSNIFSKLWSSIYGHGPVPNKQPMPTWWNNVPKNQTRHDSYLNAVRQSMNSVGNGPADSLVMASDAITQDDIQNYVTDNPPITDDGVTSIIDPADVYDISSDFNDPNNADPSNDNTPYNLYANPDNNNYEVITSKQLYDQSEYPDILDEPYQTQEVTYSLDDLTNNTYATPRDSINNSENIDPSLTDGVVYYPDNTDVNNQNLFDLIRTSIDDRVNTTQSVYLENSVMDDSVFTVS